MAVLLSASSKLVSKLCNFEAYLGGGKMEILVGVEMQSPNQLRENDFFTFCFISNEYSCQIYSLYSHQQVFEKHPDHYANIETFWIPVIACRAFYSQACAKLCLIISLRRSQLLLLRHQKPRMRNFEHCKCKSTPQIILIFSKGLLNLNMYHFLFIETWVMI